mgnify:CR=1 FL=1
MMRNAMLAILALSAATVATVAAASPAARVRLSLLRSRAGVSASPATAPTAAYNQCMASASGRRPYCNVNPRVAFGQQRRMRVYRDY